MKLLICFFILNIFYALAYGQNKNETLIFYFEIENNGSVKISLDSANNAFIVRYHTSDNHKIKITDNLSDSVIVFTYSYYLRGGGKDNAGLDLNSLHFYDSKFNYEVYDNYSAESDNSYIGIKISNKSTTGVQDIHGINNTRKGELLYFRFNDLIPSSQE